MFQCSPDSFLHNSSDLELHGGRIPGQQQSVQHVQELDCQQLRQSGIYSRVTVSQAACLIIRIHFESHTSHLVLTGDCNNSVVAEM